MRLAPTCHVTRDGLLGDGQCTADPPSSPPPCLPAPQGLVLFLRSAMHKLLQPFNISLLDGACVTALGDAVRLRGWCAACLGADNLLAMSFHSLGMQDEPVLARQCSCPSHPHISRAC